MSITLHAILLVLSFIAIVILLTSMYYSYKEEILLPDTVQGVHHYEHEVQRVKQTVLLHPRELYRDPRYEERMSSNLLDSFSRLIAKQASVTKEEQYDGTTILAVELYIIPTKE